jgi:hypothetical protein
MSASGQYIAAVGNAAAIYVNAVRYRFVCVVSLISVRKITKIFPFYLSCHHQNYGDGPWIEQSGAPNSHSPFYYYFAGRDYWKSLAMSANGQYLAAVSSDGETGSIWVNQVNLIKIRAKTKPKPAPTRNCLRRLSVCYLHLMSVLRTMGVGHGPGCRTLLLRQAGLRSLCQRVDNT